MTSVFVKSPIIFAVILTSVGLPASAQSNSETVASSISSTRLLNLAGDMGGHTPRGFRGQGNGVFIGDNLNSGFPNGEGVQAFISFDISGLSGQSIESAVLSSKFLHTSGTPFADLGDLHLERVQFERFSSALWDTASNSDTGCELSVSADLSSVTCDLLEAVTIALDQGAQFLQFRIRFDQASDSDGEQDLALFFKNNSNANEGGVFELSINKSGGQ